MPSYNRLIARFASHHDSRRDRKNLRVAQRHGQRFIEFAPSRRSCISGGTMRSMLARWEHSGDRVAR
jgi:hypothetical protein